MSPQSPDWEEARPLRLGEAWVRREGDQTAVYDPESGRLYALNPPALALWELCDGKTTATEMAEAVVELTSLAPAIAREQVVETLETLLAQRLISVSDEP